jgi:hypothetical protein
MGLYDLVPKDPIKNLRWRIRCRERALVDKEFRNAFWAACMEDVCFFMAAVCWGYDPRAKHKIVPFIPYPHQEYVFRKLDEAFEVTKDDKTLDVLVDKSRAQGGTFGYLLVDLRRWLRESMFSAGYVTRNADLVDSKTDSDTVLWKVQFSINMLPAWMQPKYERNLSQHTFENKKNGSLLKGYSAGQDVAAGGRATVFTMDEAGAKDFVSSGKDYSVMESLHDVTNYLRLVSARYIDQGVFHEACEAGTVEGGWHLVLDWKDHPIHSKNAYIVRAGMPPEAIRPHEAAAVAEYHKQHPNLKDALERKGYKYEDAVRSPWYDMRCLRKTARPQLIASQLDRNPKGAVGKVFPSWLLDLMKQKHVMPPVWRGVPIFDSETLKLTGLLAREDGPLSLWFKPGIDDSPPLGPFTLACDIAIGGTGAYSSNSVVSGLDDRTGEQVLEYVIKGMEPRAFARQAVGLALWMRKALLGWEDSGMSSGFAKEVMEVLYYGNVYYRETMQLGTQRKSRKPGFPCRDADKADMFERFALAMEKGEFIPRSAEMIVECSEYEWEDGKIIHAPTKNRGAKEKNHGDRVISGAGAWLVFFNDKHHKKVDEQKEMEQNPEYGSFLWREQQERQRVDSGSPYYGLRDVIRR